MFQQNMSVLDGYSRGPTAGLSSRIEYRESLITSSTVHGVEALKTRGEVQASQKETCRPGSGMLSPWYAPFRAEDSVL